MSEQAFITLLNCAVRDPNRNGSSSSGYVRQEWRDIWFTSHTFRRAGSQYQFMFPAPERRWSLRMVKWWAGWTQNESTETLARYLLDHDVTDEDKQLADCLAPDRELHLGCPTTYSDWKDMYRMYWTAEPSRHLFKPVSEWSAEDRKKSWMGNILVYHVGLNPAPPCYNCGTPGHTMIQCRSQLDGWARGDGCITVTTNEIEHLAVNQQ
ncbi:hypothetical protein PHMEG_0003460 [Phytophthora megakarya]|uniref:CCHC-type domain-containing protein n=1 Tax=Phytophthora megakarya TaxID=4795 RepID=A0A225WY16_9STRA|nr:hypothetical protein PHMEG_0003460 [Phytophthora megakarya]